MTSVKQHRNPCSVPPPVLHDLSLRQDWPVKMLFTICQSHWREFWYATLLSTLRATHNKDISTSSQMLITDIYLQHYGDANYVREASKHMSCGLEVKQFFYFLVSSADLDILCTESFSHHVNYLMVAHKISNKMGLMTITTFCDIWISWSKRLSAPALPFAGYEFLPVVEVWQTKLVNLVSKQHKMDT